MNTDIKNQHHILEAIDQLRRRKARPDIDRICNFVTKRFAVDSRDTKADLQRCVENSIVYKVEYKGSISYRNAAKKSYGSFKKDPVLLNQQPTTVAIIPTTSVLINSPPLVSHENKIEMSKLFANIVTTVVADLYLEDSDYLQFGVPLNDLVKRILTKHPSKFSKKTIIDLLQQEVDNGGLIKMETGNFSLGPSSSSSQTEKQHEEFADDDEDDYLTVNTSCDGSPPLKIRKKPGPKPGKRKNDMEKLRCFDDTSNMGIRMGGRRKRAKKVFDPSDNNLPRLNRKRGRPLGSLNKSTIEKQSAALITTSRSQGTSSVNSNYNSNSNNASDQSPGSRPTSRASSTGPMGGGNSSSGSIGAGNTPRDTNQGGVCSVCHLQGKKGVSDKMISCRECSNKAHVSCLNTDDGMLRMSPDNTWQCPHCKTCVVCYETSDAGTLTVCQICADAYHSFCHEPKITEKSKGGFKWVCANCQMEPLLSDIKTDIKQEIDEKEEKVSLNLSLETETKPPCNNWGFLEQSAPSSPHSAESTPYTQSPAISPIPPTLSPQNTQTLQNGNSINQDNRNSLESTTNSGNNNNTRTRTNSGSDYKFYNMSDSQSVKDFEIDETFDPSIPDASNWTYDDVYNYFVQYFPEEAIVFKEQEIDGHSLLLMKRVDVLTSLNLKLGPALKIYRHVLKLQVRRDDHKLYWL